VIANWADVEPETVDKGRLGFVSYDLGEAAGTINVGVTRAQVRPGKQSSPVHVELDEEEIFFVLSGSGLSWQNGAVYEVGPGDCIVHRVGEEIHTLVAGDDGLDVLAFGERTDPTATYLPRAQVVRMGVTVDVSQGPHPFDREAAAGDLELPEPSPRPQTIVNVGTVEPDYEGDSGRWVVMARKAGAVRTGLNWGRLEAGRSGASPHCHSADEEIFVILEGGGTLELWPSPVQADRMGNEKEQHAVRAGDVISRPPSTGLSHYFLAGSEGMTFLAYGTRRPNDVCYYPRSNKIYWRGLGLIARLEPLDYKDGEPE
jgi:uncharacterized cupin superfamily protein